MTDLYIAPGRSVAARALAGEMMLMDAHTSTLFTLNPTASVIFEAADGTTPLRQIVRERVCSEFAIDEERAYADAIEFVRALAGTGALVVSESPIVANADDAGDAIA